MWYPWKRCVSNSLLDADSLVYCRQTIPHLLSSRMDQQALKLKVFYGRWYEEHCFCVVLDPCLVLLRLIIVGFHSYPADYIIDPMSYEQCVHLEFSTEKICSVKFRYMFRGDFARHVCELLAARFAHKDNVLILDFHSLQRSSSGPITLMQVITQWSRKWD